jgi:hypothetical protein
MPTPNNSQTCSMPLKLIDIMIAIAIVGIAFAWLPTFLAAAIVTAVSGILVLKGLRWPTETKSEGWNFRLLWLVWILALFVSPVGILVLAILYKHTGPPDISGTRPWAVNAVIGLEYAHLCISVCLSISVVALARGINRWMAWAAIAAVVMFTLLLSMHACMDITGLYL